jgi:hypothetical protein
MNPIKANSRKSVPISNPEKFRFGKMNIARYATSITLRMTIEIVIPRNEIAGLMLLIVIWS